MNELINQSDVSDVLENLGIDNRVWVEIGDTIMYRDYYGGINYMTVEGLERETVNNRLSFSCRVVKVCGDSDRVKVGDKHNVDVSEKYRG